MATPDFSKVWASNSPLPEYTFSDADYVTGWDFVGQTPPTKNEFDAWFRLVDTKLKWLYDQIQQTASKLYPVGSVYISFNATDPSTLFGGTWVRLKDRFLLASGDAYAANTTGGSATKTIAINNMPAHNHSVNASGNHSHTATTSTAGNHSHTRGSMNITGNFGGTDVQSGYYGNGAFAINSWGNYNNYGGKWHNDLGRNMNFDASRSWTGSTSTNGNHAHTIGNTGSGTAFTTISPYITAYVWRRTA